jgi:transposase InsO family protein
MNIRQESYGETEAQDAYGEIFYTLKEAQVLIEEWRLEYNTFRPRSSLKYRTPVPEAWLH